MSTQGPNPLRPYYIPPPPVGLSVDSLPPPSLPSPPAAVSSSSGSSFSLLSDLQDYTDYLDAPSPNEVLKSFLTQAAIQYSLNLIAQPFENSKTVLQCRIVPKKEGPPVDVKKKPARGWNAGREYVGDSDDDDDDDVGLLVHCPHLRSTYLDIREREKEVTMANQTVGSFNRL